MANPKCEACGSRRVIGYPCKNCTPEFKQQHSIKKNIVYLLEFLASAENDLRNAEESISRISEIHGQIDISQVEQSKELIKKQYNRLQKITEMLQPSSKSTDPELTLNDII